MKQETQHSLDYFKSQLFNDVSESETIIDKLSRSELEIQRIEPNRGIGTIRQEHRTWLLYTKPIEHLRQRFDLSPEILVVLIPAPEAQARDIDCAERAIVQDTRLDRGLVLVVARDEKARDRLEHAVRHTGRLYLFFTFSEVCETSDPVSWLRRRILEVVGSSDLFAVGSPVFGWDFIGRKQDLLLLRRNLEGGIPVGLFGLRKIGKTSVIRVLERQLIADARFAIEECSRIGQYSSLAQITFPIYIDLLRISFRDSKRSGFMRVFLKSIIEGVNALGLKPSDLGLDSSLVEQGVLEKMSPRQAEQNGFAAVNSLIEWARQREGHRRVVVFIDEYERLISGQSFKQKHGADIFDYFRGLVQSYPGIFNFLIAGLNRKLAIKPLLAGHQNPLLNFIVEFQIKGLDRREMQDLLQIIGHRLSLHINHDAVDFIWKETGGHPFLARRYGRLLDKLISIGDREPRKTIDVHLAESILEDFRRDVVGTMEEIGRAVSDLHQDAPFALSYLVSAPDQATEALAILPLQIIDDLKRLGILEEKTIRINCFAAWVKDNYENAPILEEVG